MSGYFIEHLHDTALPPAPAEDPELYGVAEALARMGDFPARVPEVLRDTIDQLLDGQRTGRYDWKELMKTEKTHMGTLVEINLQREFEFADGDKMDFCIAGEDVDCKFSQKLNGWEIPPEAVVGCGGRGHICMVVWADDYRSRFKLGLVRADDRYMRVGTGNRDRKRRLTPEGFRRILWLLEGELPPNLLLHLDDDARRAVFTAGPPGRGGGQKRVDELFRQAQGACVRRSAILTAGQQDDAPKRARDSRLPRRLGREGFLVLGHLSADRAVAEGLGLPVPRKGQWVSARVAPAENGFDGRTAEINGSRWRLATADDTALPAAPRIRGRAD